MKIDLEPALNHFDYFTDIEKTFIKRRGKHLMIGPLDWALIESWQEREIPLRIVLSAINEVFDSIEQRAESTVNVRSLKYCSDAVERLFKEWSAAHVGGHSRGNETAELEGTIEETVDVSGHIRRKLSELNAVPGTVPHVIGDGVKTAANALLAIQEDIDRTGAEERLDKIETDLDDLIVQNRAKLLDTEIESRVVAALKSVGLNIDTAGEAFDRVFCKEVRIKYSIPRLSMFEL